MSRLILQYLDQHPKACDTLAGIVEWWMLKVRAQIITTEVQKALDELVSLGVVLRDQRPEQQPFYRLDQDRWHSLRLSFPPQKLVQQTAKDGKNSNH